MKSFVKKSEITKICNTIEGCVKNFNDIELTAFMDFMMKVGVYKSDVEISLEMFSDEILDAVRDIKKKKFDEINNIEICHLMQMKGGCLAIGCMTEVIELVRDEYEKNNSSIPFMCPPNLEVN